MSNLIDTRQVAFRICGNNNENGIETVVVLVRRSRLSDSDKREISIQWLPMSRIIAKRKLEFTSA